jgi:hypothetical protein
MFLLNYLAWVKSVSKPLHHNPGKFLTGSKKVSRLTFLSSRIRISQTSFLCESCTRVVSPTAISESMEASASSFKLINVSYTISIAAIDLLSVLLPESQLQFEDKVFPRP